MNDPLLFLFVLIIFVVLLILTVRVNSLIRLIKDLLVRYQATPPMSQQTFRPINQTTLQSLSQATPQFADQQAATPLAQPGQQAPSLSQLLAFPPPVLPAAAQETIQPSFQTSAQETPALQAMPAAQAMPATQAMPAAQGKSAAQEKPAPQEILAPPPQWHKIPPQFEVPVPAKASSRSYETLFGKNIVGIVASILTFIGLIFLGFLVVPFLSDVIKVILMFAISAALTVAGYLFNRRYANNFTKALLGTGCGAFFIAIQITHLYFGFLNDIVAFLLLLVWIAGALFLARQSQSLLVGIIAHVGMIFSICTGYLIGMSDDKILLLLGYQLVSTVLIVAGNIFCCKKLYRFGLFATLTLTLYASIIMWSFFNIDSYQSFASDLPVSLISCAFIVQFVGSSFLVYLLFVSIVRVKNSTSRVLLQLLNLSLWQVSLLLNVSTLISKLYGMYVFSTATVVINPYDIFLPALVVTLAVMYVVTLLIVFLRRALRFDETLEMTTVLFFVISSSLMLIYNLFYHSLSGAEGPNLVLLVIPAVIGIVARLLSSSKSKLNVYCFIAFGMLALDALTLCIFGYWELTQFSSVMLSVGYLALLLGLSAVTFRLLDQAERKRLQNEFKITALLVFEISLVSIFLRVSFTYGFVLLELLCLGALLILHLLKQDTPRLFFRVNEFILYAILCIEFAINGLERTDLITTFIHMVAVICALLLILDRIRLAAQANTFALRTPGAPIPNTDLEGLSALAIHGLILSTLQGLTSWLDQTYALSLASMIIALVIITLGFWSRTRSLRLYGLVIVILCVLKMVLFDLGGLDTLMRVVAFIGGGVICFGISALYNFAVKRFYAGPPAP